jgi:ATP-binding cassette, subfamily B, bacterial
MSIQLFPEEVAALRFRDVILARLALLLSSRLVSRNPQTIERVLLRWAAKYPPATRADVLAARASVCSVSARCRTQEGCLRRSLAVAMLCRLRGTSAGWCTGFASDPFRAHAWVEVDGQPVGELPEVSSYLKVVDVHRDSPGQAAAGKRPDPRAERTDRSSDEAEVDTAETAVSIRHLFALAHGRRAMFVSVVVLGVLGAGLTLALPFVAGKSFQGNSFKLPATPILVALILLAAASGAVAAVQNYLLQRVGEDVVRETRERLSSQLLRLPIAEYDHRSVGDLLSRITSDAARLRLGFIQTSVAATNGLVLIIGGVAAMAFVDVLLLLASVTTAGVMMILLVVLGKWVQFASLEAHQRLGKLAAVVERNLVAIRTIRAANATNDATQSTQEMVRRSWLSGMRVARINSIVAPVSGLGVQATAIFALGLGAYRVSSGAITVEQLAQFTLLLFLLLGPLTQLSGTFSHVGEALGALARIQGLLELPPESAHDLPSTFRSSAETTTHPVAVSFDNVVFSYTGLPFGADPLEHSHALVLHGLTLQAHSGQRTALVGPSGAGKSTVLQLVERFYDVTSGSISIFGRDITQYSREELRKLLAFVEQDSPVLSGSLRDNLTLGTPERTDDECVEALRLVDLAYLLERSEKGLDQTVGESGAALSGGEKQRLGIARALLSDAPILLLDEATANLDSRSERRISDLLRTVLTDRTVIVVTHRLSTVLDADVIYVVEHGRVVGSGRHHDLMETVPLYRELAKEQHLVPETSSTARR